MKEGKVRTIALAVLALGLMLGALAYGMFKVASDLKKSRKDALEAKNNFAEAVKKAVPAVGERPAKEVFDPAFLQAVFGDNAALMAIIRKQLQQATSDNPVLVQSDITVLATVYTEDAQGQPTDVVTYLIGNLMMAKAPGFTEEGYFQQNMPAALFDLTNSVLGVAGRQVQILGEAELVACHRAILAGVMRGDASMFQAQLLDKQHVRAVIPNPAQLMPESISSNLNAIILKLDGSTEGGSGEVLFVTTGRNKVADVSKLLAHWRTLAISWLRVYSESPKVKNVAALAARTEIQVEGAVVSIRGGYDEPFFRDVAMRTVWAMGRAYTRLQKSPDLIRVKLNNINQKEQ